MQSLDYPNTEEKRRGRKKAPERERDRESATTPLNLLTSSRESLKKKASTFTRTETTQSSFPLVWFSLLNSSWTELEEEKLKKSVLKAAIAVGSSRDWMQRCREREREKQEVVEVSRWHLKISFKISNRNQSPVGLCCRHHNKPPHPHPKKRGKKKEKEVCCWIFCLESFSIYKKKKLMRLGDWSSFCPHKDFGCFLVVCVNSLLAQLEALLPSFLPSFQGLVISIKDLLTPT